MVNLDGKKQMFDQKSIKRSDKIINITVHHRGSTRVFRISSVLLPKKDKTIRDAVHIKIPRLGLSIIDKKPDEFLFITLMSVGLDFSISDSQIKSNFVLMASQIDNQCGSGDNVILKGIPPDSDRKGTHKTPFFQSNITFSRSSSGQVFQMVEVKNAKIYTPFGFKYN
eukprot:UN30392